MEKTIKGKVNFAEFNYLDDERTEPVSIKGEIVGLDSNGIWVDGHQKRYDYFRMSMLKIGFMKK